MFKMKKWMETLTDVITMTKKEYVLTITTSLLGGIVLGFVFAPKRTKHTTVGSHNCSKNKNSGNGNGYQDGSYEDGDDMEELEDEDDVIHFN